MRVFKFFAIMALATAFANISCAQGLFGGGRASNDVITYETLADEPYGLNTLWLHFNPMVADVFMTNYTLGWGLRIDYLLNNKIDLHTEFRSSYGRFTELSRNAAIRNAVINYNDEKYNIKNRFVQFGVLEVGGAYHIKDTETKKLSKIVLSPRKRDNILYNNVGKIEVTAKVRTIYSARLGGMGFGTTADLTTALRRQGQNEISGTHTTDGNIKLGLANDLNNRLYTTVESYGLYTGGSYSVIRNVSVKTDKYGNLANNIIFNAYADVLVAPWVRIADVVGGLEGTSKQIRLKAQDEADHWKFGYRVGFDLRYNQDAFWSFGGEFGQRPSFGKRSMYFVAKFAFPVFSFKFNNVKTAVDSGTLEL